MKKSLFLVALLLGGTSLSAQTVKDKEADHKVETNMFRDNWFVSVGFGAQFLDSDLDNKLDFFDRISPAFDINLGKWFTPGFGVRLGYYGYKLEGVTDLSYSSAITTDLGDGYYKEKYDIGVLHVDAMFNIFNLIKGYKADRCYSLIPYIGTGWAHCFNYGEEDEQSFRFGVINKFRLNDTWDINIEPRVDMVHDRFDKLEYNSASETDVIFGLTVGVTYNFPSRGWQRRSVVPSGISDAEMQSVRDQLEASRAQNAKIKEQIAVLEHSSKIVERIEKEQIIAPTLFIFPINSPKLTRAMKTNASYLAKQIKDGDSDAVYLITGYADRWTGNDSINERLSSQRAQAMYDFLVNEYGVNSDQLKMAHKGGVENMYYNDRRLSRAVIVEVIK